MVHFRPTPGRRLGFADGDRGPAAALAATARSLAVAPAAATCPGGVLSFSFVFATGSRFGGFRFSAVLRGFTGRGPLLRTAF